MGSKRIIWDDEWIGNNTPNYTTRKDLYDAYIEHIGYSVLPKSFQSHCYSVFGAMTQTNIKWEDEWIIDNFDKFHFISDLCDEYNRVFGCGVLQQTFSTHVHRMGLRSESSWTVEEDEWIMDNYHILGCHGVDKLNEIFGHNRTERSFVAEAHRLDCYVDEECIEKNRVFSRRVPIGTIKDDGDGYLKIKTGNGKSGWERLHRVIYKNENGTDIPKGSRIMFLDNDRNNISSDNLVAVPYSYSALMNNNGLKSTNPTITKAGILWCELNTKLKEFQNT